MSDRFISSENLDWLWRISIAQFFILFLLLLSIVSYSFPHTDSVRPFFILMPLYYWSIYRPSLVIPLFCFLIGLWVDIVSGFPIGLHAALFLLVNIIIKSQRLFLMGQPYPMFWLGFVIVSTSVYVSQWLFFALIYMSIPPLIDTIASNIITILLFPFVAVILTFIQRILPLPPKSY